MNATGARVAVAVVVAGVATGAAILVPRLTGGNETADGQAEGIEGLVTVERLSTEHVPTRVAYEQSPPLGGKHYQAWLDCGVYDEPVYDEMAVHDLEHGAIWLTYDPETLSADDVARLADQLPDIGIMSPYEGQDAPVVATAWGRQVALDGVDDPRLPEFVDAYEGASSAPEAGVGCAGGINADQLAQLQEDQIFEPGSEDAA